MTIDLKLGETPLILQECQRQGLLRNQAAYVLATAFWETAHTMEPVREAFWLSEDWRAKNLRYYPWYGRGFVQLTWETNYEAMGRRLGLDLTTDPDVVMRPDTAAKILVVGMREGIFTGKKLDDYITLQSSDYRGARRIVNGMDKASAIAELAEDYEAALLGIGYGVEKAPPIINERKDGTQPRSNPAKSKTILAQILQWLATFGAVLSAWYGDQSEMVQVALIAFVGVVLVAGVVVFRERLKKWADGIR